MLDLSDYIKNVKKESTQIQYVEESYVIEKYSEEDLLFFETSNRMSDTYLWLFKKNNKIDIFIIEETSKQIVKKFSMLDNIDIYKSEVSNNYDFYECGFGGLLCVRKTISEIFNKELNRMAKENEIIYFNGKPDEMFIHAYWITIAKKILI